MTEVTKCPSCGSDRIYTKPNKVKCTDCGWSKDTTTPESEPVRKTLSQFLKGILIGNGYLEQNIYIEDAKLKIVVNKLEGYLRTDEKYNLHTPRSGRVSCKEPNKICEPNEKVTNEKVEAINDIISDVTELRDLVEHKNSGTVSRFATVLVKLIKLKLKLIKEWNIFPEG